jgi:hypothetical protein
MTSTNEDRIKEEQIPKDDSSGSTQKVISEQGGISGQRKEVNVESYSEAANLGQLLKDLEFPVSKEEILEVATKKGASSDIVSRLNNIPNRDYSNVSEVSEVTGVVKY